MSFNILVIAQSGRLQYEAVLFAASLRAMAPHFSGRLIVAEPQPGPLWPTDPGISSEGARAALETLGAEILPFDSTLFGASYPIGNKIEALHLLPEGEPFIFFDTDTLITGPIDTLDIDFDRPSASLKREGTWPEIELYGPGYAATWKSLYDRFGLTFDTSLDLREPDEYWERYLYFNAGWFYYSCPRAFGARFAQYAKEIRDNPPAEVACQTLFPWLDQIALPLVVHSFGGGREGPHAALDGDMACHWRLMPLLFARESDHVVEVLRDIAAPNKIKQVLKEYEPFKRMIYQPKGQKVRDMFDRANLPRKEQQIRNQIKRAKLWVR